MIYLERTPVKVKSWRDLLKKIVHFYFVLAIDLAVLYNCLSGIAPPIDHRKKSEPVSFLRLEKTSDGSHHPPWAFAVGQTET